MKNKTVTVTVEQIHDAFLTLNFRDPNEWHWKKFLEALLSKERKDAQS